MFQKTFTWLCVLLATATYSVYVKADDPYEIMNKRIGTFKTYVTHKKAEWTPEEVVYEGEETIRWGLDKKILIVEGTAQPDDMKSMGIMSYDEQEKVYRWWFWNNKNVMPREETKAVWNARTNSMIISAVLNNGQHKSVGEVVYTSKDRFDWKLKITDRSGKVMMDMVGYTERKK